MLSKNITLKSQQNITKSQTGMDSFSTYALLTASFFFVTLSFALLLRYRQVSQRINVSNDLGHDLWSSLEQRLKKQDERILDLMGRVEVIQARVTASVVQASGPTRFNSQALPAQPRSTGVGELTVVTQPFERVESHEEPQKSQAGSGSSASVGRSEGMLAVDETQLAVLRALSESPRNTRQLTDAIKKSREHTARLMKGLFEAGLVQRDDSSKPFVYQITDLGLRSLSDTK